MNNNVCLFHTGLQIPDVTPGASIQVLNLQYVKYFNWTACIHRTVVVILTLSYFIRVTLLVCEMVNRLGSNVHGNLITTKHAWYLLSNITDNRPQMWELRMQNYMHVVNCLWSVIGSEAQCGEISSVSWGRSQRAQENTWSAGFRDRLFGKRVGTR